ncbi:MAG TPA: adenylate/guanylate cyclase domain-containing protein [Thermoanaerobaculia bacterium]|nr:adenylate/guanylate cyclase domain-containing protein [Thermoanaerobaculia bacterium]
MNRKALAAGSAIGILWAAALATVSYLDSSRSLFGLEWLFYDPAARRIAREHQPDPRVVILAISEESLRVLEPEFGRWPYPRSVVDMALREIGRARPAAVVFDIFFSEQNRADPQGDRDFAESLGRIPTVLAAQTDRDAPRQVDDAFRPKLLEVNGQLAVPVMGLRPPHPEFSTASAIGTIRLSLDPYSSTTRRYPIADRLASGHWVPSLGLASANLKVPQKRARWSNDPPSFVIGGLQVPTDGRNHFLIRWNGSKKHDQALSYEFVDFNKVIQAAFARQEPDSGYSAEQLDEFGKRFRDRIVVVGLTGTDTSQDLRATPLSPSGAGVEIHANAIDNLINRDFNRQVSPVSSGSALVLVCGLLGSILYVTRSQTAAILFFLIAAVTWIVSAYGLMRGGSVWPVIAPLIALSGTYGTITVVRFTAEQRQTAQLKATFGRYVSPQILKHILDHPEKVVLGGERRDLTILFSDIRGFTTISEAAEPEEVVEMLNIYLTRMVEILLRHGGTLDKFIGDAVMGFWNAPTAEPDHARRAVECAIEMIDETARLRAEWEAEGKPAIRIGVGVNTGEAVAGNIGSSQVFGYTVIGDAVNLASRLESKNKDYGTEIIVSEFTKQRMGDGIESFYLDDVKVKGKENAVKIYEVKGT